MAEIFSFEEYKNRPEIEKILSRREKSQGSFLKEIIEKYPFASADIKKYGLDGFSINYEKDLVSIERMSPAEKTFAEIIKNGGDQDFVLEEHNLGKAEKFFVFVPRKEVLVATTAEKKYSEPGQKLAA